MIIFLHCLNDSDENPLKQTVLLTGGDENLPTIPYAACWAISLNRSFYKITFIPLRVMTNLPLY